MIEGGGLSDDLRIAIHEAGHAVALYEFCGLVPELLTLVPDGDRLGSMRPKPPMQHLPEYAANDDEVEQFSAPIAVYYAGAVAVSLFLQATTGVEDGELEDLDDAPGFDKGFEADQEMIDALAWRAAGGDEGSKFSEEVWAPALLKAQQRLAECKLVIWEVAQRLLQCRTLVRSDLEPLLKRKL